MLGKKIKLTSTLMELYICAPPLVWYKYWLCLSLCYLNANVIELTSQTHVMAKGNIYMKRAAEIKANIACAPNRRPNSGQQSAINLSMTALGKF